MIRKNAKPNRRSRLPQKAVKAQRQRRVRGQQANRPPREIKMDWDGLKRRTRQITRMPFPISNYTIAPDSRTIVFVTTEPAGPPASGYLFDSGRWPPSDASHRRATAELKATVVDQAAAVVLAADFRSEHLARRPHALLQ